MSTPTNHYIPLPGAEEITTLLEKELQRQQDVTPEAEFSSPELETSYKLLCEIEHERFGPDEVEKLRSAIYEPQYWKTEAFSFQNMLVQKKVGDLRQECTAEQALARAWRSIAQDLRRQLLEEGLSANEVSERRLAIEDNRYWEPEADRLRQVAAFLEAEMFEQVSGDDGNSPPLGPLMPAGINSELRERNQQRYRPGQAKTRRGKARSQKSVPKSDRVLRSAVRSKVMKPGRRR